jgi:PIN domain nuclease of toxin-antitoxin system
LLLDTNTVLWTSRQPSSLSPAAKAILTDRDTERIISAVTPWELCIKAGTGKLPAALPLIAAFDQVVTALSASELPITRRHAILAGQLPWEHKDPFDRMLAAQALSEGLTLLTKDRIFSSRPDLRVMW